MHDMKKSFMFLLAFCGLIALLVVPGTVGAQYPPPLDQTYYVPNTGGGYGGIPLTDWGAPVGVDQHTDFIASQIPGNYWLTHSIYQQIDSGVVVLWNDPATLPTSLPSSLHTLLTQDGDKVNDLLVCYGGVSRCEVISLPKYSLLPLENSPNTTLANAYNTISDLYGGFSYSNITVPPQVILQDTSHQYTKYVPMRDWPGWDESLANPSAQDIQVWQTAYQELYQFYPNYPATPDPSTWIQYTYYVENDIPRVPEPGLLLLLGSGFIGLAGMRRVIKK
jgi:hypothetical protein